VVAEGNVMTNWPGSCSSNTTDVNKGAMMRDNSLALYVTQCASKLSASN
jgi:hypothetical protein